MQRFVICAFILFGLASKGFAASCEESSARILLAAVQSCNSIQASAPFVLVQKKLNIVSYLDLGHPYEALWCEFEFSGFDEYNQPIKSSGRFFSNGFPRCFIREQETLQNNSCPVVKPGSIIFADNQDLSERISLPDARQELVYVSSFQPGRKREALIDYALVGGLPREYIQSFDVKLYKGSTLVDEKHFENQGTNIHYRYQWDGTGENSNSKVVSQKFVIQVTENSPAGSLVRNSEIFPTHFLANQFGLYGWLPSDFYFYDVNSQKLFSSNGKMQLVELNLNANQNYFLKENNRVVVFNSSGRQTETRTALTGALLESYHYDAQGYLTNIEDAFGKKLEFLRNPNGQSIVVITPSKTQILLEGNQDQNLVSVTDAQGARYQMSYHFDSGLLSSYQKPTGQTSYFEFDSLGLLIKDIGINGAETAISKVSSTKGPGQDLVVQTNRVRSESIYNKTVNFLGSFFRQVSKSSTGTEMTLLDEYGNSRSIQNINEDNSTQTMSYIVDNRFGSGSYFNHYWRNNFQSVYNEQSYFLNEPGNPFSISDWSLKKQLMGTNSQWITSYQASSQELITISKLGDTLKTKLDPFERPLQVQQNSLNPIQLSYQNDHLASISQGAAVTNFEYDSYSGRLQRSTNAMGEIQNFSYDANGRLSAQGLPDGRIISYQYDAGGDIAKISANQKVVAQFEYFDTGLSSKISFVKVGQLANPVWQNQYQYNADKKITLMVRPGGEKIKLTYENSCGALSKIESKSETRQFQYSASSGFEKPTVLTSSNGVRLQFSYDQGRLIGQQASYLQKNFIYEQNLSRLNEQVTSDAISSSLSAQRATVSYLYNDDVKLIQADELQFGYDQNHLLSSLRIGTGDRQILETRQYDLNGKSST